VRESTRRVLERVADRCEGAEEVLLEVARQLERGESSYRATHWGDQGPRTAALVELPDVSRGLVELGELVAVVYRTKKGRTSSDWMHDFDQPFPKLAYTRGGDDLVIVRGGSKYRVTSHGIVR